LARQNAEPGDKKPESKAACDNHSDREAVITTDGSAFQVMNLCEECVPPEWQDK
jgi:hypothetical protein